MRFNNSIVPICLLVSVFSTGISHAQPKVYMVGGGDPATLINLVYILLLTDGIPLFDEDNNEVFIPGLGYDLTFIQGTEDNAADAEANFDLVFIHESVSSVDADRYINKNIPIVDTEDVLMRGSVDRPGGMWLTPEAGRSNATGDFEIEIIDNTHPITGLWGKNETVLVTFSETAILSGINIPFLAPAGTPLAKTGFVIEPERYVLVVADTGATGFKGDDDAPAPAGADPAPNRRVFLGFSPNTQAFDAASTDLALVALSPNGALIFQRAIQWALGAAVTADGTEAGVQLPVTVSQWSIY